MSALCSHTESADARQCPCSLERPHTASGAQERDSNNLPLPGNAPAVLSALIRPLVLRNVIPTRCSTMPPV
jgi:hypothetical protein